MALENNAALARRLLLPLGGPLAALILVLVIWDLAVRVYQIPAYVLPSPEQTWAHILDDLPVLLQGFRITFITFLMGFILGAGQGFMFAVLMDATPMDPQRALSDLYCRAGGAGDCYSGGI